MKENNDNLKFKKSTNINYQHINPQKRAAVIKKIMEKYNISSKEANEILIRMEQRREAEKLQKIPKNPKNPNNINSNVSLTNMGKNIDKSYSKQVVAGKKDVKVKNFNKNISNNYKNVNNNQLNHNQKNIVSTPNFNSKNYNAQNKTKSINFIDNSSEKQKINTETAVKSNIKQQKSNVEQVIDSSKSNEKKVDSLLEEIIPNYNQQISIDLKNVDLTFEVQNEKVDTLKESFIRTIKRNKSKKIKIHALKDISFKIYKGEKVGIIGYNGAGKSTLLNVITGIYPPDKGSVTTRGNISPLLSLGAGFDQNFSGRKNIILNGAVLGYDKKFLESKIDEIIEFSELGEFIDIPIKNYSSGMMAKLGFSIATAVEPDILIIDEILGVGDVNFAKKSRDKMRSLMDGGTTVLLVSHSIPQIREICDKAIWIDQGSLREMGEVNKVCDHYLKDAEKASNEQLANIQFR